MIKKDKKLIVLITGWLLTIFFSLSPMVVNATGVSDLVHAEQKGKESLLSNIRQLTFEGRRAGEGYFSKDGSKLIFQSERVPGNPFYQICLMDLETGDVTRVSPGFGKTTCAWIHPGGEKVLFSSTHEDPKARTKQKEEIELRASGKKRRYSWDFDEHYDIYESDLQGNHLKNLTNTHGYDAESSWSPDGKLIAFASNRHAYKKKLSKKEQAIFEHDKSYFMDIYVMNADGTNVRRLTETEGYDGGPFFSANGKKIVWRRFSKDSATSEIFTMNVDGTDKLQITKLGAMSWAPFFHPSGDYVIFATNLHGFANFELYMVDTEGRSRPVRVTYTQGFDGLPVFSPDGERLSWTSSRTSNKQPQIFMADWNDGEARRLLGQIKEIPAYSKKVTKSSISSPDLTQTAAEIRAEDLRLHITYLASEEMDGRLTGTEGERLATKYVASVFKSLGLEPAGDNGTFFQHFEFTSGVSLGSDNRLSLYSMGKRQYFAVDKDWRPLAFSRIGKIKPSEIVFAGYGIVSPGTDEFKAYDSFTGLDIKNKWVLVFRYLPEDISPELRQHLNRYSRIHYKAMIARDKGARGMIVVSGPNTSVKDELVKLTFDAAIAGTSIAAISITNDFAERLLRSSGEKLKDLQDALDKGKPLEGFSIPGAKLSAVIDMEQEKRTGRNVLARLNANANPRESKVVVGAHVDHLGHGIGTNSLALDKEKGRIHYGADDNASGVAGLLEIAQYLTGQKARGKLQQRRDILFAAWSGEEIGFIGSNHFTRQFGGNERSKLTPDIAAYLNMDMIGRLDKALILQGVGSSSLWLKEIERRNVPVGLPIITQKDSYLPTDATPFYLKGVPILNAFTGANSDYHTPRDRADKINYEGTEKIARLIALITRSLAIREDTPDYIEIEKPKGTMGRADLRAYLGTIPDYSQGDTVGVKLSGAAKGGPAAQAGVKAGDVIVELAGRKIENIYDYTYAIDALKIGEPVEMVILRDGERLRLTVTPSSRE